MMRSSSGTSRDVAAGEAEIVDLRKVKGEATRRALIDAAIRVMAARGLEGTTFATIAEASGLSRGLVTFHFKTKDQLIAAALNQAGDLYEASWDKAIRRALYTPEDRVAAVVAHDIGFVTRHPEILSLWYTTWGEARSQALYRTNTREADLVYVGELTAAFAAMPEQMGKPELARAKARAVNALVFGLWLDSHIDPDHFDSVEALAATEAVLRGLAPGWSGRFPDI